MKNDLIRLLAGRQGHFEMESGYHSEWWYDLDLLFTSQSETLRPFVLQLSERLRVHQPEAVCGPMTGGAKLAEMIARELDVSYFYTERREHPERSELFSVEYELPDEQRLAAGGKRLALVDDAISAGSAVRGTHAALAASGACTVAVGALFLFGNGADRFAASHRLPLEAIARLPFALWKPEDCPLCRAGVEIERISEKV